MSVSDLNFKISRLGEAKIPSTMKHVRFVRDDDHVIVSTNMEEVKRILDKGEDVPRFEMAGPRDKIFFDPSKLNCGIVTCGGLCPGLNDVIRAIVLSLHHHYGVRGIFGFRYGYEGLTAKYGHTPMDLTPEVVDHINESGGTILGSSRQSPPAVSRTRPRCCTRCP